jgi:5-methylthioadenosine/S-adenosylhomocysteine deaminase
MTPMHDLVGCAVMQAATANVDTVLIAGRVVKQGGKLLADRLAEKMSALQRSGERILAGFKASAERAA